MSTEVCAKPLIKREILTDWPTVAEAETLGYEAHAFVHVFVPGHEFGIYVTGSDFCDTVYGLIVSGSLALGMMRLSTLEWARDTLGLPITQDADFQPTRLQSIGYREAYRLYAISRLRLRSH